MSTETVVRTAPFVIQWRGQMKFKLIASLLLLAFASGATAQANRAGRIDHADLAQRFKEVQGNSKLSSALLKTGRSVATLCANCHGEGGNSVKPEVPNLARQNPAYLLEQVRQFADGRRLNTFMQGMIKAMTVDEKIAVVLYYSSHEVLASQAVVDTKLIAKGKQYYLKTCWRCHGEDGHGNENFARIAGQQPAYLNATLKRYRVGTGARVDPMMAANTRLMSDADIDAVTAYVASMR